MHRIAQRPQGEYRITTLAEDSGGQATPITAPGEAVVRDGAGVEVYRGTPSVVGDGLELAVPVSELPSLDTYTVDWIGTLGGEVQGWSTAFELVGGFILRVAALRALDRAYQNETEFPADVMAEVRDAIEELAEKNGMCAFRPKGARRRISGSGRTKLVLPDTDVRDLYSASIDGTALTEIELAGIRAAGNVLWREDGWDAGFANVDVHYAYGYDRAPGPVVRGALAFAQEYLVPSALPARATSQTVGDMVYRITIAGRDGPTGVPQFDAAIEQFGRIRPQAG